MTAMRSGALFLTLVVLTALGNRAAVADTWWYAYEADGTYPEAEGWERIMQGGGAERYFEDGSLALDDRGGTFVCDSYYRYMPSLPDPSHPFRMEWRMLAADVLSFTDPGIAISFAPFGYIDLMYDVDSIYSGLEGQYVAEFAPGVFHEYVLMSSDMLTYQLSVDGALAHVGVVVGPSTSSWAQWGDMATGKSLSLWDYARFGVVPEPAGVLLFGLAGLAASVRRSRHVWRTATGQGMRRRRAPGEVLVRIRVNTRSRARSPRGMMQPVGANSSRGDGRRRIR